MKFSKKIMITLFICFFISGAIFTIVSSSVLKIDVDNMVESIGSIVLYTGDEEWTILWTLREENEKLKVTWSWDNFIINKNNEISSGENSSILWWSGNTIFGWISSTILGWIWNNIQSNLSVILWWSGNNIYDNSTGSVVAWSNNSVNPLSDRNLENSVIIWNDNRMNGSYSSVVGNNSEVWSGEYIETYNSVAMWSWATVLGNNSFLWVDGSEGVNLRNDNVFVVYWGNGMAVNESEPNSNAKFNVWWHFVLAAWNSGNNIQCGSGNGTWIVKIEDRDDIEDQKCLCSCDGEWWKSMIWEGQCESICRWEKFDIFPECVTWWIKIVLSWGKKMYSWECIWWSAIEWSYYMQWNTIWWQCQWKNGNTTPCSYKSECTWYIPWLDEWSAVINNNLIPSILSDDRVYRYSEDKTEVCTYSCKTWYALNSSRICSEVCNQSYVGCNLWEKRNLNQPTYTNDYEYGCWYDNEMYKCEANCNGDKIWNGSECVDITNVCGNEKYTCLLWNVSNTWTDFENYIWNCVDEREIIIGSCSKAKEIVNRIVYYNYARGLDGKQNVHFFMTGGDIPIDIKIKQSYEDYYGVSYDMIYTIKANQKVSNNASFDREIRLGDKWWFGNVGSDYVVRGDRLYVKVNDILYVLRIVDYNGLCANSCSTAWQCLRWSVSKHNLHGNRIWDKYKFTWGCKLWNQTEEQCEVECEVDAWKCEGILVDNAIVCDPSSDPECNIKGSWDISLADFYMDISEEKIVWSRCGIKRHCVFSNFAISCRESREVCTQQWFKCEDNYVLNGCSCISVSNICLTSRTPWGCMSWMVATGYSEWEWKSKYSYYCEKEGMERVLCEASCGSGQIWNGSRCTAVPELCGEKHNNCINQSSLLSNQTDDFAKKYKRTCKLWNNTQECSECYTWYIMSWSECKVKPAVDCEAMRYRWYRVPDLVNGSWVWVEKDTTSQVCDANVKCQSWSLVTYAENCRNACNTWTNLWTCLTWLLIKYPYIWNVGDSEYTYKCRRGYGDWFSCREKCPTGEYWDGSKCANINVNLCGESHYNCINGWSLVYSILNKSEMTGYTIYNYKWWCILWNYQTWCNETVDVVHNCKWWETISGYYIKNNIAHGQELTVTKTVNGTNCTATAICGSGTISIVGEDCTNACPGWIMDTPRCNFAGVNPTFKQSATWTSWYTYKCGESLCSANCSNNKIWNGNTCVSHYGPYCRSGVALSCTFWNVVQVDNGEWWYTWNCSNINNENLNESICYKCNTGYEWKSGNNKCEEKSCNSTSKNGYSIPELTWSTNKILGKNIANGSCTVMAICSKWNLTLTGEECTCNNGYYLSGKVCNVICGDNPVSIPCNWPYIPAWVKWWNDYTLWWHNYLCNRWTSSQQCNCGDDLWWNGSRCQGKSDNNCGNGVDQCKDSVLIESTWWNWWNMWKCGVQGLSPDTCYVCNEGDGYEWSDAQNKCVRTVKTCGWSEPSIANITKWSSTYKLAVHTSRTYVSNTPLHECEWTCDYWYEPFVDNNGDIVECNNVEPHSIHGCSPDYEWICWNDGKIHCSSTCSTDHCGEVSDTYCKSNVWDKPSDNACNWSNWLEYRKCYDNANYQITWYCRRRNSMDELCSAANCSYFTSRDDCVFNKCCVWEST